MTTKKCLVVDDSMVARMIIIDFMKNLNVDWEFQQAANGQLALDKLTSEKFDFMTVDYNMPVMTGPELLQHRLTKYPAVKSVLLTANVQEQTSIEADELQVKCLHKPITAEIVSAIVDYFTE